MASSAQANQSIPVTVDNFTCAETGRAFAGVVIPDGFGKFLNYCEVTPIDKQIVPRSNRDTLYSLAIVDLDAGAAAH